MPLHTTDALILRTYKLNEADRIVVFLTRDRGKKRGVAKGARRLRSRFRGALEPLTRASVVYFEKESRELVSLNDADPQRSPLSAFHPEALTYVGYFAELIDQWAQDSDPNERLFRLGAAVLDALAEDVPIEALARYFEYWLLRLQGVYPSVSACHRCAGPMGDGARLSPAARVLVCRHCAPAAGALTLSPAALQFLRAAATLTPARIGEAGLTPAAGRELGAVHRALIAWHLDREPRSARVLREMRH
jgi:DNA repair protein RecO (recombination protein O)